MELLIIEDWVTSCKVMRSQLVSRRLIYLQ